MDERAVKKEDEAEIKELLQYIELKEQTHRREMAQLRDKLIKHAALFESYSEMYIFVKANTFNLESFCSDMFEARGVFDKAQEERDAAKKKRDLANRDGCFVASLSGRILDQK